MCQPVITNTICGIPLDTLKQRPTPSEIANLFCTLSDGEQAEFFVAVEQIGETWRDEGHYPWAQWSAIGRHLAACEGACGGSAVIDEIHSSLHLAERIK